MNQIDSLKQQIEKAEIILNESRDNYNKNPDSYSAKLLLMSMENHLSDLHIQLQKEIDIQKDHKE